jgi:hypothetical protein
MHVYTHKNLPRQNGQVIKRPNYQTSQDIKSQLKMSNYETYQLQMTKVSKGLNYKTSQASKSPMPQNGPQIIQTTRRPTYKSS